VDLFVFAGFAMAIEKASDEKLMGSIASGDMSALGELARRHQGKVLALAYRILGRWEMAEDVGQETFLRVYKAAKRYKPRAKFTTWVYRIVVNLCIDEQRKLGNPVVPLEQVGADVAGKPEGNGLERKELAMIVQKAISELPERQRVAVILHRYDGLSHSEISEATGWSKSAVESLLVRAYANLRNKLCKIKDFTE